MKRAILHDHPAAEEKLGVGSDHVIVDRAAFEETLGTLEDALNALEATLPVLRSSMGLAAAARNYNLINRIRKLTGHISKITESKCQNLLRNV